MTKNEHFPRPYLPNAVILHFIPALRYLWILSLLFPIFVFPDFPGLPEALDPHANTQCITVQTAGSPYLRISLTLSALLNSDAIVLLIFGEKKRAVIKPP